MARAYLITLVASLVAPALADPEILPIRGMHYGTYNTIFGEFHPSPDPVHLYQTAWSATERPDYYFAGASDHGWVCLDWGDLEGSPDVLSFVFSYATTEPAPARLSAVLLFFAEENGHNGTGRVPLAGYEFTDLPAGGATFNGWIVTVDLRSDCDRFTIHGSDLDFADLALLLSQYGDDCN